MVRQEQLSSTKRSEVATISGDSDLVPGKNKRQWTRSLSKRGNHEVYGPLLARLAIRRTTWTCCVLLLDQASDFHLPCGFRTAYFIADHDVTSYIADVTYVGCKVLAKAQMT